MAKESKSQQATVERVMHEFKQGELEANGRKVRNPRQAIAIGLSEAGASNRKSPEQNRKAAAHTRKREQASERTRAELYAEATRLGVAGRSRMTKAELERAVAS